MNQTDRLFIATPLPANLHQKLAKYASEFQHPAIRLVPDENLHLTLFFIGNIASEKTPEILKELEQLAAIQKSFPLNLEAIEAGPNKKHPRLIWARFGQHPAFSALSTKLQQAFSSQKSSKQKPIPHITLARFRKDKSIPENLPEITPESEIIFEVNEMALWKSELKQPHPEYSILQKFNFKS